MTLISAYLEGIGLLGPGVPDWPQGLAILAGQTPYQQQKTVLSPPASLPPAERRRASPGVMAALEVGHKACAMAGVRPAEPASVFASSGGDGRICHAICSALASGDTMISPTQFHNSVHNAISGYWGIAAGAMTPSSVVSTHDGSFAAGLLEAVMLLGSEQRPVLLIACDSDYPQPLHDARPVPDTFAVALLLTTMPHPGKTIAQLSFCGDTLFTDAEGQPMDDHALETLRQSIPAARCLPLLQLIARGEAGRVVLDYVNPPRLAVDVAPCS
ncbi:MAG: beta-ketoacyl synthase chain length factor [Acidithiobacillus sp.]|nr:beta-ketoacyl synthase chain length factor [Acidithiobacillus sp.]